MTYEMVSFIRRLFCKHDYVWDHNIYGDEIIQAGYNRSWWRCRKCGKYQLRPELHREDERVTE